MASDFSGLKVNFVAGTLGQGGAERQLYYIVEALCRNGAAVSILCLTRNEFWESRIRAAGAEVVWVGRSRSRLVRLARIAAEAFRRRPHVLQSQHFYANCYVAAAARLTGILGIGAIRNDVITEVDANGPVFGNLNLKLPRLLIANSQFAIRNALRRRVKADKLLFLPNCVDTAHFQPARPRMQNGPVRLLSAGRLVAQKRHDGFLRVLQALVQSGANVRGTIVGAGPLRDELESTALRLGLLPEAIEYAGAVEDMRPWYHNADVLVLSSSHEGTPNVVLEAMACGLPVVAAAVGGVPDIVVDGLTGLLATAGDEAALTAHVKLLANNPELRAEMGANARRFVEQRHSISNLPSNLAAIYQTVLPHHPAAFFKRHAGTAVL